MSVRCIGGGNRNSRRKPRPLVSHLHSLSHNVAIQVWRYENSIATRTSKHESHRVEPMWSCSISGTCHTRTEWAVTLTFNIPWGLTSHCGNCKICDDFNLINRKAWVYIPRWQQCSIKEILIGNTSSEISFQKDIYTPCVGGTFINTTERTLSGQRWSYDMLWNQLQSTIDFSIIFYFFNVGLLLIFIPRKYPCW